MNNNLTNEIIRHIYNNLGVKLPNCITNLNSIMQDNFLLSRKVCFEGGDNKSIWGVEIPLSESEKFYIAFADLSEDNVPEYAMVAQLEESPTYGTYMSYKEFVTLSDIQVDRPLIGCYLSGGSWSECSVYMQGAFLSGMEKLKEANVKPQKLEKEEVVDGLIKFIEFYQDKMEMENEGQED